MALQTGEKTNMRGAEKPGGEKEAAVGEDWCDAEMVFADWQLAPNITKYIRNSKYICRVLQI